MRVDIRIVDKMHAGGSSRHGIVDEGGMSGGEDKEWGMRLSRVRRVAGRGNVVRVDSSWGD